VPELDHTTYTKKEIVEFTIASSPPIVCLEQIVSPLDPKMAQLFVNMLDILAYVNWSNNKTKAKYNLYKGECLIIVHE
jgi:hypothetical protein